MSTLGRNLIVLFPAQAGSNVLLGPPNPAAPDAQNLIELGPAQTPTTNLVLYPPPVAGSTGSPPINQPLVGLRITVTSTNFALMPGRITVSQGTIIAGTSATLPGQSVTVTPGTITPEIAVVLTGARLNFSIGIVNAVQGQRVTVSQGVLTPSISVGASSTTSAVTQVPVLTATRLLSSGTPDPRIMRTQFLSANGKLYGTGEWVNVANLAANSRRTGTLIVDQATHETFTWTENGSGLSTANQLELATSFPFTDRPFPRLGSLPLTGTLWPVYTSATYQGGWISLDTDGNIQSMYTRTLINTTESFGVQHQRNAGFSEFLAWQAGDLGAGNYNGPELFIGRNYKASLTRAVPSNDAIFAPMGIYAVSQFDTLAFYTRPTDLSVVGTQVTIAGCKAVTAAGTLTATTDNHGVTLTGLRATTNSGSITPVDGSSTIYQPLTGQSIQCYPNPFSTPTPFFPGSRDAPLTGLGVTVTAGTLIPHNPQQSVGVAFRRLQIVDPTLNADPAGYVWGNETNVTTVTGADALWALPEHLTVVHSGYGDVVYVIYLHSSPDANPTEYIGLLVLHTYTGQVVSNTVTLAPAWGSIGTWYPNQETTRNVPQERSVAQVVKLSSGSSVTQFLFDRNIVNLSWDSSTITTPTVTVKSGPSISDYLIPGFEHIETRGDEAVHVLYGTRVAFSHIKEDLGRVYVNDITSTSSTWNTITTTSTVDGTPIAYLQPIGSFGSAFEYNNDHYSGSGSGQQSFLYLQRWSEFFTTTREDTAAVWVDYWNAQPKMLSVSAKGKVGRVGTIVSNPINQQLTGQRINTAQGTITPGVSAALTGQQITTTQGTIGLGDMYSQLLGSRLNISQGILYTHEGKLTGQQITVTRGTIPFPVYLTGARLTVTLGILGQGQVRLSPIGAVTNYGLLTPTTDASITLTGLRATTTQGSLSPALDKAFTGARLNTASGVLGVQIARSLTGGLVVTSGGVLTPSVGNSATLTGQRATTAQGTLLGVYPTSGTPTGQRATFSIGSMGVIIDVVPSSGRITVSPGIITPALSVVLTGARLNTAQGACSVAIDKALTGQRATLTPGALGVTYGSSVVVTGVKATGKVGDVSSRFPVPPAGSSVWAVSKDMNDLPHTVTPDEFVVA